MIDCLFSIFGVLGYIGLILCLFENRIIRIIREIFMFFGLMFLGCMLVNEPTIDKRYILLIAFFIYSFLFYYSKKWFLSLLWLGFLVKAFFTCLFLFILLKFCVILLVYNMYVCPGRSMDRTQSCEDCNRGSTPRRGNFEKLHENVIFLLKKVLTN